jgi:hypothetical protein
MNIKYFSKKLDHKYYHNNNVIYKNITVYRFSNDNNDCNNCELSVFNMIKKEYIYNIKTYKYLIQLKSDIIMASYMDSHSGVDSNYHRYLNIEHIINYNRGSYNFNEIELMKKYLNITLNLKEYTEFKKIFTHIGIGKNHQHNELVTNKNKIIQIYDINNKEEIIKDLRKNKILIK